MVHHVFDSTTVIHSVSEAIHSVVGTSHHTGSVIHVIDIVVISIGGTAT